MRCTTKAQYLKRYRSKPPPRKPEPLPEPQKRIVGERYGLNLLRSLFGLQPVEKVEKMVTNTSLAIDADDLEKLRESLRAPGDSIDYETFRRELDL